MWAVLGKNMSNGLEFSMNFEWTKSMDLNSLGSQGGLTLPDSTNPSENYGLSDFDVRLHFAGTAVYNLPFHGNRLVSGYQLSSIFQYQTGNPVNITGRQLKLQRRHRPAASDAAWPDRPFQAAVARNRQRHPVPEHRPGLRRHDLRRHQRTPRPAALRFRERKPAQRQPPLPPFTPAWAPCSAMPLPGRAMRISTCRARKTRRSAKAVNFNLRVDAFDILNHPNFGQPSGTCSRPPLARSPEPASPSAMVDLRGNYRSAASSCSDRDLIHSEACVCRRKIAAGVCLS